MMEKSSSIWRMRLKWLAIGCSMLFYTVANGLYAGDGGSAATREYQIKAAFLYHFIQFVEWPDDAMLPNQPIVVGILGVDPFGADIETLKGKEIRGRPLLIQRYTNVSDVTRCHLLFISASERNQLDGILKSLHGESVLTVGEMDAFVDYGGIINFILLDNKIRFQINTGAAEKAGLRISSKLLKLAKPAKSTDKGNLSP